MPFIGNKPADSFTSFAKQDFTTSATTSYTLDYPVTNANEIALFINFVRQEPTTAYTATGTSLTLSSATSASDDMYAVFLGKALQTVNPPAGSVGTSQLASGAVTAAKIDSGVALGKVLQVVQTNYSGATSFAYDSTWGDIDVFDTSITPSSTSSKILITYHINLSTSNLAYTKIRRGTTDIAIGDAAGSRVRVTTGHGSYAGDTNRAFTFSATFLDSPSSTSQLDYNVQGYCETSNTAYINRSTNDPDNDTGYRMVSSLTLTEIAG